MNLFRRIRFRLQTWFWAAVNWIITRFQPSDPFGPDDPAADEAAAAADAPTAEPDTNP